MYLPYYILYILVTIAPLYYKSLQFRVDRNNIQYIFLQRIYKLRKILN